MFHIDFFFLLSVRPTLHYWGKLHLVIVYYLFNKLLGITIIPESFLQKVLFRKFSFILAPSSIPMSITIVTFSFFDQRLFLPLLELYIMQMKHNVLLSIWLLSFTCSSDLSGLCMPMVYSFLLLSSIPRYEYTICVYCC